jgi:hypothetical protein
MMKTEARRQIAKQQGTVPSDIARHTVVDRPMVPPVDAADRFALQLGWFKKHHLRQPVF